MYLTFFISHLEGKWDYLFKAMKILCLNCFLQLLLDLLLYLYEVMHIFLLFILFVFCFWCKCDFNFFLHCNFFPSK